MYRTKRTAVMPAMKLSPSGMYPIEPRNARESAMSRPNSRT